MPKANNSKAVYMKIYKPRESKWPPKNLIYMSHFSATKAKYEVPQNIGNFVEFTRITNKPVPV